MILFITSAALLYWAAWLYYTHVIKPIRDEQDSHNYENAKALTFLGNSEAVCKTAVIEECPDCNGSTVVRPYTASQLVRVYQDKIISLQQEEEDNARQDAYLKSKGIN